MHSTPLFRILDASLNRAGEGLRVVEDYVRFVLDDPLLTAEIKSLRHEIGQVSRELSSGQRHAARDTLADVGTAIGNTAERERNDTWAVCAASLKRTEQSLRSLEEYGKLFDADFASRMETYRYRLYTLERAIDVGRCSRELLADARLCVLVDGCDSAGEFERLVGELVAAGVGMIQLRDKRLDDRELIARARLLVALTRQPPAPPGVSAWRGREGTTEPPAEPGAPALRRTLCIVNDRADIAAAVHADGVHLGQDDLSVKDARAVVGPRMLIGVSTHNIEQARAAVFDGANYIGTGPTFPSRTKSFNDFAGLDYLRQVAAEFRLPTFAIGGITAENLPDVLATSVTRVAVGAAVTAAAEPASAARELLAMLDNAADVQHPVAEATAPSGS